MKDKLEELISLSSEININEFYFIRMDGTGITFISSSNNDLMSNIAHCSQSSIVSDDDFIEVRATKYPGMVFKFER